MIGSLKRMFCLSMFLSGVLLAQAPSASATSTAAHKPAAQRAVTKSSTAAKIAAAKPKATVQTHPMTDEEKTIYALGLSISRSLGQFNLTPAELEIVKRGLTDGVAGKPAVDLNTWGPKIRDLVRDREKWPHRLTSRRQQRSRARSKPIPGSFIASSRRVLARRRPLVIRSP